MAGSVSTDILAGTVKPMVNAGVVTETMEKAGKKNQSVKKSKGKKVQAKCVGLFVDALDKQNLWCEAKIIACDLVTGKIKVHFNGWNSRHDLWTDPMGIAPHGKHTKKKHNRSSWTESMPLFPELLRDNEEEGEPMSEPSPQSGSNEKLQEENGSGLKRPLEDSSTEASSKLIRTAESDVVSLESHSAERRAGHLQALQSDQNFLMRCAEIWETQWPSLQHSNPFNANKSE